MVSIREGSEAGNYGESVRQSPVVAGWIHSGGEAQAAARVRRLQLGHRNREDALVDLGVESGVVEALAQAQFEQVILLHCLDVEGAEVRPDEAALARADHEVGAASGDLDARGVDPGDIDDEFHGTFLFAAVVVRVTEIDRGGRGGTGASAGFQVVDDRIHGKIKKMGKVAWSGGEMREAERLEVCPPGSLLQALDPSGLVGLS